MNLIGMNCGLMRQYIEFVADRLLVALHQSKVHYLLPNICQCYGHANTRKNIISAMPVICDCVLYPHAGLQC